MEKTEALNIVASNLETSKDFERIWKIYPTEKSNKARAFRVFKRKWIDTDIEALEKVIKMYLEEARLDFLPHFDNLLHSRLEAFTIHKLEEN